MFKKLNLNWKINIIITIFIIILMAVLSFIMYNYLKNMVLNEINDKINIISEYEKQKIIETIDSLAKRINNIKTNSLLNLYTEIVHEYYIINSKSNDTKENSLIYFISEASYNQNKTLRYLTNNNEYMKFAYITTINGIIIADSRQQITDSPTKYVGKELSEDYYKNSNIGDVKTMNNEPLLLISKKIVNNDTVIGHIVLGLTPDIFNVNLNSLFLDYGTITLINEEGLILSHNDRNKIGLKFSNNWFLEEIKADKITNRKIINDRYYILNKISDTNVYFAVDIPASKINEPAKEVSSILIYIIIFSTIIILVVITFVISSQLKPLFILSKNIDKVGKGDFDVKVDLEREDVIGHLAHSFNKMVIKIKELLNQIREDEQQIRKYELNALQAQINPHFLYNTLDSINWMSKSKEYDDISEITIALSKFFRLSLNKGKEITTLGKELEHVRNYMIIQKLRYPNKFNYEINVGEELLDKECIKLILQPLVENSLIHGLTSIKQKGEINISANSKDEFIILSVCDNGSGFDPEKMEDMINKDNNLYEGYALKNIKKRIKLKYGSKYGIYFYQNINGGACIELKLPNKDRRDGKDV